MLAQSASHTGPAAPKNAVQCSAPFLLKKTRGRNGRRGIHSPNA